MKIFQARVCIDIHIKADSAEDALEVIDLNLGEIFAEGTCERTDLMGVQSLRDVSHASRNNPLMIGRYGHIGVRHLDDEK